MVVSREQNLRACPSSRRGTVQVESDVLRAVYTGGPETRPWGGVQLLSDVSAAS